LLKHGASDKQRVELFAAIAAGELRLSFRAYGENSRASDLNDVGLSAVEDGGGGFVLKRRKSARRSGRQRRSI